MTMTIQANCYCIESKCAYWELSCPSPKRRGHRKPKPGHVFRSELRRRRAVDASHRRERGLVDYDRYDVKDLKVFASGRGLTGVPKRASKTTLKQILDEADDNMVFSRFMDLPPELRLTIYNLHLNSFSLRTPARAAQPPITKVSRSIRQETLPLFYRNMHVWVKLLEMASLSGNTAEFAIHVQLPNYVERLSAATLARVRKIEVYFVTSYVRETRQAADWVVDLYPDEDGKALRRDYSDKDCTIASELAANIERHLFKLVRELLVRPAHKKLQIRDFTDMGKACEKANLEPWSNETA